MPIRVYVSSKKKPNNDVKTNRRSKAKTHIIVDTIADTITDTDTTSVPDTPVPISTSTSTNINKHKDMMDMLSSLHREMKEPCTLHYTVLYTGKIENILDATFCIITTNYLVKGDNGSIHAEDAGIMELMQFVFRDKKKKKIIEKIVRSGIKLFNVRLSKTCVPGNSRPCHGCIIRINNCPIPITEVKYTDSQGNIIKEYPKNMYNSPLTKESSGTRHAHAKKKCNC